MWKRAISLWSLLGVGVGAVVLWAGSRFSQYLVSVGLLVTSGAVAAMIARWRRMNGSVPPRADLHQYEEMKRDLDASSRYLIKELQHTTATLRKKTFDMHNLFTITGEMSVITDLDALLNGFLLTLMGRVGCYAVLLFLKRSDDSDDFSLQCWKGIGGDEARSFSSIPVRSELVTRLRSEADPIIIRDDVAQDRLGSELLQFKQFEVAAPLLSRHEVTGISFLGEKADGKHFSEMDLELISILSHQVSAAIENAKLLEKTRLFYNSSIAFYLSCGCGKAVHLHYFLRRDVA